jgi:methylglyoxal synthase
VAVKELKTGTLGGDAMVQTAIVDRAGEMP